MSEADERIVSDGAGSNGAEIGGKALVGGHRMDLARWREDRLGLVWGMGDEGRECVWVFDRPISSTQRTTADSHSFEARRRDWRERR